MSLLAVVGAVALVAVAVFVYFDRKALKAKAANAEALVAARTRAIEASLKARERTVKSALSVKLYSELAAAKAELGKISAEAAAILEAAHERIRKVL